MRPAFAAVIVLCVLDAFFTLDVLSRGAIEANPVMRAALDLGDGAFVILKLLITAAGGALLLRLQRLRVARTGLGVVCTGYVALLGYHIYGQLAYAPLGIGLPS